MAEYNRGVSLVTPTRLNGNYLTAWSDVNDMQSIYNSLALINR